jgi:hypothetical protein
MIKLIGKYNGTDDLEPGTILGLGRYGKQRVKVVSCNKDEITLTSKYGHKPNEPYIIKKMQLKNSIIYKEINEQLNKDEIRRIIIEEINNII